MRLKRPYSTSRGGGGTNHIIITHLLEVTAQRTVGRELSRVLRPVLAFCMRGKWLQYFSRVHWVVLPNFRLNLTDFRGQSRIIQKMFGKLSSFEFFEKMEKMDNTAF